MSILLFSESIQKVFKTVQKLNTLQLYCSVMMRHISETLFYLDLIRIL